MSDHETERLVRAFKREGRGLPLELVTASFRDLSPKVLLEVQWAAFLEAGTHRMWPVMWKQGPAIRQPIRKLSDSHLKLIWMGYNEKKNRWKKVKNQKDLRSYVQHEMKKRKLLDDTGKIPVDPAFAHYYKG